MARATPAGVAGAARGAALLCLGTRCCWDGLVLCTQRIRSGMGRRGRSLSFWVLTIPRELAGGRPFTRARVPEKLGCLPRQSLLSLSLSFSLYSSHSSLLAFHSDSPPPSFSPLFFPSFCFSLSPILTLFRSHSGRARGYRIYLVRCATLPSDSPSWLALALFDSGLNAALQGGQMCSSQEAVSMDFQRPLC